MMPYIFVYPQRPEKDNGSLRTEFSPQPPQRSFISLKEILLDKTDHKMKKIFKKIFKIFTLEFVCVGGG